MQTKIDVVITWVDGSDPVWLEQKREYDQKINGIDINAKNAARYRDWENLQYVFRGIEKFMPWVNNVFFVTCGHLPKWLNVNCEKLKIVKHSDFIPSQYLPTFNSNAIELNFHRIDELSENFINFNDDMFVVAPTKPEDFFVDGIPKDMAVLSPAPCFRDVMCCIEANNFGIINDYFSVGDINRNWRKWYNLKYGKLMIRTMLFSRFHSILGIYEPHIPISHLKSVIANLWDLEEKVLNDTCMNRFRGYNDVNVWLFRHWQIMTGKFVPRRKNFGVHLGIEKNEEQILKLLRNPKKYRVLCINDSSDVTDFEIKKNKINSALDFLLPEKSAFEK